jgi:hypothetical protein
MKRRTGYPWALLAGVPLATLGACQTAGHSQSGFLTGYDGLTENRQAVRASIREGRDDAAAAGVVRVRLEPAVLVGAAGAGLSPEERRMVLREVDRQVCYEVSERFDLSPTAEEAARLRVGVTAVKPNGRAAGGLAAAANHFIPGPGTVRVPGTTGGLAAEVELTDTTGRRIAALTWARDAQPLGTDAPSLSRIGDALQLAEPFGDAVGDAISDPGRKVRPIPDPDPCAGFGPRIQPGGFLTRAVTGLYVPEINTGAREEATDTPPR